MTPELHLYARHRTAELADRAAAAFVVEQLPGRSPTRRNTSSGPAHGSPRGPISTLVGRRLVLLGLHLMGESPPFRKVA